MTDYIDPRELSAVWISHLHPDHAADLATLASWALNTPDAPKLRVMGPHGWDVRLNWFITESRSRNAVGEIFDVEYLTDGSSVRIGELQLTSRQVHHSVASFGLRVSGRGSIFAYSGDSGPCPALEKLAANADLLLCEAGAVQSTEYHMTSRQSYELARSANVGRLLLTHIPYGQAPADLSGYDKVPVETVSVRDEWLVAPSA